MENMKVEDFKLKKVKFGKILLAHQIFDVSDAVYLNEKNFGFVVRVVHDGEYGDDTKIYRCKLGIRGKEMPKTIDNNSEYNSFMQTLSKRAEADVKKVRDEQSSKEFAKRWKKEDNENKNALMYMKFLDSSHSK